MSAMGRAICSGVLGLMVLYPLSGQNQPTEPQKSKAAPPAKPAAGKAGPPAGKSAPQDESVEKRRERMKQRDGEIDRILKGSSTRNAN